MKKLLFTLLMLYSASLFSGTIKGRVRDKDTKEPIPFANIIIERHGIEITEAKSDFDGKFEITNITDDTIDIKVQYVGYQTLLIKEVKIETDKITFLELKLTSSMMQLNEVVVSAYRVPLLARDQTSSGGTVTSEDMGRMSGRNSHATAASVGGVYKQKGNSNMNVRGARNAGTVTYIDGVRVKGNPTYGYESDEEYDAIIENDYKDVKQEPLSTFSLDVDVASYSNIRRYLQDGYLPPADAVRIEEMINYFPYNYPEPEHDEPFAIVSEMADCPWNSEHKLLHIGIQGEKIQTENLPHNNLVFLIDVSGSMACYNKLPLVQKSLKMLVSALSEEDRIAIVTYAGSSGVALKPTSCKQKEIIYNAIESLSSGGSTAGSQGITTAYQLAKENYKPNANNRVILCTDGDFNVGITEDTQLIKLIEERRNNGIFLSVLGYGIGNYKDSKMEKLADKGNGNYAYIDNLMEAQKVLVNEMNATLQTIAKDVKIQVEFNPVYVASYKLIGYENRMLNKEDFNDDTKDAGEVGAGKSVTALYELVLASDFKSENKVDDLKYQEYSVKPSSYQSEELATLKLRYKQPKEDESILITHPIINNVKQIESASSEFQFASSVAEFGLILRSSKYKAQANFAQIISRAKQGKGNDEYGYRAEFIRLTELAQNLALAK